MNNRKLFLGLLVLCFIDSSTEEKEELEGFSRAFAQRDDELQVDWVI